MLVYERRLSSLEFHLEIYLYSLWCICQMCQESIQWLDYVQPTYKYEDLTKVRKENVFDVLSNIMTRKAYSLGS